MFEFATLISLIAVVAIIGVAKVGENTKETYCRIGNAVGAADKGGETENSDGCQLSIPADTEPL